MMRQIAVLGWPRRLWLPAMLLTALTVGWGATRVIAARAAYFTTAPSPGYLLYPRLGLCAPIRSQSAPSKASLALRASNGFRIGRKPDAIMPPDLGETLKPEQVLRLSHDTKL